MYTINSKTESLAITKVIEDRTYNATLTLSGDENGDYQFNNFRSSVDKGEGQSKVHGVYTHDEHVSQNIRLSINPVLTTDEIALIASEIATIKEDMLAYLTNGVNLPS